MISNTMKSNINKKVIKLNICLLTIAMTSIAFASQGTPEVQQKEALSQALDIDSDELFQTHKVAFRDLNNDDKEDAVIIFQAQEYCGSGGCQMAVYQQYVDTNGKMAFKQVSKSSVNRLPVYVYENTTNGWNDISVNISGGGMPAGIVKLKFNGDSYPSNPTSSDDKYIETIDNELDGELLLSHE